MGRDADSPVTALGKAGAGNLSPDEPRCSAALPRQQAREARPCPTTLLMCGRASLIDSCSRFAVYSTMSLSAYHTGICTLALASIASQSRVDIGTARTVIKDLVRRGYLEELPSVANRPNRYRVGCRCDCVVQRPAYAIPHPEGVGIAHSSIGKIDSHDYALKKEIEKRDKGSSWCSIAERPVDPEIAPLWGPFLKHRAAAGCPISSDQARKFLSALDELSEVKCDVKLILSDALDRKWFSLKVEQLRSRGRYRGDQAREFGSSGRAFVPASPVSLVEKQHECELSGRIHGALRQRLGAAYEARFAECAFVLNDASITVFARSKARASILESDEQLIRSVVDRLECGEPWISFEAGTVIRPAGSISSPCEDASTPQRKDLSWGA